MKMLLSGVGISALSGTMGGTTASHNPSGPYLRNRGNPVNPNSPRQQQARNQFKAATQAWSDLTDAERASWLPFANAIVFSDSLGQDYKISPFAHYVRSYLAMVDAGLPVVSTGPSVLTLPEADPTFVVAASEATQTLSVTFDNALAWANEDDAAMRIAHSVPVSPSREFMSQHFRTGGAIEGDGVTPPPSPASIGAQFTIAEGQKINVDARIMRADGRVSEPFQDTVTIGS